MDRGEWITKWVKAEHTGRKFRAVFKCNGDSDGLLCELRGREERQEDDQPAAGRERDPEDDGHGRLPGRRRSKPQGRDRDYRSNLERGTDETD